MCCLLYMRNINVNCQQIHINIRNGTRIEGGLYLADILEAQMQVSSRSREYFKI